MATRNKQTQTTLLYVKGCHAYHRALDELVSALVETGREPHFDVIMVETNDEAERLKFFGSPAVQVGGKDVDPRAEKVREYKASSCRPYRWEGVSYDYPPKDMIVAALT